MIYRRPWVWDVPSSCLDAHQAHGTTKQPRSALLAQLDALYAMRLALACRNVTTSAKTAWVMMTTVYLALQVNTLLEAATTTTATPTTLSIMVSKLVWMTALR